MIDYDKKHDILYVWMDDKSENRSYSSEHMEDDVVMRDAVSGEISGFIIFNFSQRKKTRPEDRPESRVCGDVIISNSPYRGGYASGGGKDGCPPDPSPCKGGCQRSYRSTGGGDFFCLKTGGRG